MAFLTAALCQILLVRVAVLCFQAELELSDQVPPVFEENTYRELLDENERKPAELFISSLAEDSKDASNVDVEAKNDEAVDTDQEEVSERYEEAEKRRRGGGHRRANAEKRKRSKQERLRAKHQHKMNIHNKGSDMLESNADDEAADKDGEIAHFYLTKPSDVANMSEFLGPGPVPIPLTDPTTKVPTTHKVTADTTISTASTISGLNKTSKLGLDDVKNVANISSDNDELAAFVGEYMRGNRRRLKPHNVDRLGNKEFLNWHDESEKQLKKEGKTFHKHNSKLQNEHRMKIDQRVGHKKRKRKFRNCAISTKKDIDKYRLNDEEQLFTNLSALNKSLKKGVGNRIGLKNKDSALTDDEAEIDEEGQTSLEKEELSERAKTVVDKISDRDANKLSFLNIVKMFGADAPPKERKSDIDKKNSNGNSRRGPQKGIKSKIEHGDWVYQVTLFPLPDYSIRKRKTHDKKKLSSTENDKDNAKDSVAEENKRNVNEKYKNKQIVDKSSKDESSLVQNQAKMESGSESDDTSEYAIDLGLISENEEETEVKRHERDTESEGTMRKSKDRQIFNRHKDTHNEKVDKMYDVDTRNDDRGYSSFNKNDENAYGNQGTSEKDEYSYEYDSNLSGDEKAITNAHECLANQTTPSTPSTCSASKEILFSTVTTKKTIKPKSSPKPSEKNEIADSSAIEELKHKNQTDDPLENFLSGQLADSFVNEVLRKVKISRKISRELGYSNETDDTCDRCIELKPVKVPELDVMRNALGRCSRNSAPGKNFSTCCRVPQPMAKFLDVLVSFERENENSFYNKIQDDSTFIFTGDYPESLARGRKAKLKDKLSLESSFNKDTFDRQRLRDDLNKEKNEDKISSSDSEVKPKEKSDKEYNPGEDTASEGRSDGIEMSGKAKKYTRRYSKNKIDKDKEESFTDFKDNERGEDISNKHNPRGLHPLVKEYSSNNNIHHRAFGRSWNEMGDTRKEILASSVNTQQESLKPQRTFDRYYGKSNYEVFKQYPPKNSPIRPHPAYRFNFDDSPKNLAKDHNGFYKHSDSNRMSGKDDRLNLKNNYFGYKSKTYGQNKINLNDKYKGLQSKYDTLYNDNGEYSLYPNLEGKALEEDLVRLPGSEGGNSKMVKRFAEDLPTYSDDESNVFFEIPDIEYDLYK